MSTRLFPKGQGAAAYRITGIAACCDWVLLSDWQAPQVFLHQNSATPRPRHIFLSLRAVFPAIQHFAEEILPRLEVPFVLVSGSADPTVPRQTDQRWRPFDAHEQALIRKIATHPLLIRWFAENLDSDSYPAMAPLPTGLVFPGQTPAAVSIPVTAPPGTRSRPILCGHRVRDGGQWQLRRRVSELAGSCWKEFCTVLDGEVAPEEFWRIAQQHNFVLCVEGGGLDPSPKAWESIVHGAIPVIRKSPLQSAYRELPVAFVENWHPGAITTEALSAWREEAQAIWSRGRSRVLERLGLNYWWQKIEAAYGNHQL